MEGRGGLPSLWSLLVLIAVNARVGAVSPRIRNPEVTGAPRPVEPLFGYAHWLGLFQIFTIISMSILIAVYVVAWRRHGAPTRCC